MFVKRNDFAATWNLSHENHNERRLRQSQFWSISENDFPIITLEVRTSGLALCTVQGDFSVPEWGGASETATGVMPKAHLGDWGSSLKSFLHYLSNSSQQRH
jgi:hypothetical protein